MQWEIKDVMFGGSRPIGKGDKFKMYSFVVFHSGRMTSFELMGEANLPEFPVKASVNLKARFTPKAVQEVGRDYPTDIFTGFIVDISQ